MSWFDWMRCSRKKDLGKIVACPKAKEQIIEACIACDMSSRTLNKLEKDMYEDLVELMEDAKRELQYAEEEAAMIEKTKTMDFEDIVFAEQLKESELRRATMDMLYEEAYHVDTRFTRQRLLLHLFAVQQRIDEVNDDLDVLKKEEIIESIARQFGDEPVPVDIYDYFNVSHE